MESNKAHFHIMVPSKRASKAAVIMRSSLEEQIKYSLRAAILTRKGERKLYKEIGSDVLQLLFRPLYSSLKPELRTKIKSAVEASESRIRLLDVELESDRSDKTKLLAHLKYQIKQNQKVDQLKVALNP